jgi:hypothetical protein
MTLNMQNLTQATKRALSNKKHLAVLATCALGSSSALAQAAGIGGLCGMLAWLKIIVGTVAIIAIVMMVINNFFGKSDIIGEIITKVLIGCVIVGAAGYLIEGTGLAVTCR